MKSIKHRWRERAAATFRVAGKAARIAGRRLRGADDAEVDGAIGESLAAELDGMKGLAMKVGQILSYFDGVLPPATHEALRSLQAGAEPVDFAVLRPHLEAALGAPLEQCFDDFDERAVAAASIGQVHRATFHGRAVAVKIQYPEVEATFESDFRRIERMASLASLATAVDGRAIARELRERVVEECDYLREATWQRRFRGAFASDPDVSIPEVVTERCAGTVLTTESIAGLDFYAALEAFDARRRSAVGLTLARFAWRSFFELGTLNADPHPGNYVFPESGGAGRVAFLDFGCVRRFEAEYLAGERRVCQAVLAGDRRWFPEAVVATGVVPRPDRFDFDVHWDMLRHAWRPYLSDRFRFDFDYVREGARFSGPSNPNLRRLAIPPAWIWQQRLQWGLHAVLARLGAEGDFGSVLRSALDAD